MSRNYIINDVEMLQAQEDEINPVYIKVTDDDGEFEAVIEINAGGLSKVTSDWPYLKLSQNPTDDELDKMRTRIVELLNEAGAFIEAKKKSLLDYKENNKKGNA